MKYHVDFIRPVSVMCFCSFLTNNAHIHRVSSPNRPKRSELRATARCSLLWLRTSSPSPSGSGTRWLSAAPTGWSRQRSSSSCPWWWICLQRTLSPVLSAEPWCTVSVSSCHDGKASRHAGAPPHLFKSKRTKRWGGQPGVLSTIQRYFPL